MIPFRDGDVLNPSQPPGESEEYLAHNHAGRQNTIRHCNAEVNII
jgi:hypothetical protein